jgi:hypothetical protein
MGSKLDEKALNEAFEARPDLQNAIRLAAGKSNSYHSLVALFVAQDIYRET